MMNYKEWVDIWLNSKIRPAAKERTFKKYSQIVGKYLLPEFGDSELDKISALDLQLFSGRLSNSGLASNTVNGIISVLKASFVCAFQLEQISSDKTAAIKRPKTREKGVTSFDNRELCLIENYVLNSNNTNLFGIVLDLYTGLRIGELLALTWDDVDLKKRTITVSRSCHDSWQDNHYVKIFDSTKTKAAERVIPIAKGLNDRLRKLKRESKNKFVVGGKSEFGAEIRTYQRTFCRLLKRLGIKHKGFHSLRHSFATRAISFGMDVKTLAELLGHSDPAVTLKRYTHSLLEYKTEMMNKIWNKKPEK